MATRRDYGIYEFGGEPGNVIGGWAGMVGGAVGEGGRETEGSNPAITPPPPPHISVERGPCEAPRLNLQSIVRASMVGRREGGGGGWGVTTESVFACTCATVYC